MMLVQAKPNTQPGGVNGALFNPWYHSFSLGLPDKTPPNIKAPKFNKMKTISLIL